jgi:hypothetical protein
VPEMFRKDESNHAHRVIEDEEVIKKIPKHLGLWEVKPRLPSKAIVPQETPEYRIDYSTTQLPTPARLLSGGSDKWLYVDPEYPEGYPPLEDHSTRFFKWGCEFRGDVYPFFRQPSSYPRIYGPRSTFPASECLPIFDLISV